MWNLYSLAERNHIIAPKKVMLLNRFNIPFICVLAQGAIMLFYMIIIRGEQTTFQQLSAFGATITYMLSLAGLLAILLKNKQSIWLTILGFVNCFILISASLYTMWLTSNPIPLLMFMGIVIGGVLMYLITDKQSS